MSGVGPKTAVRALLAVLILLVSAVIGYRVLVPRDTLDPARDPYPPATLATPGLDGAVLHAPLVVDGRLRVYAAARQVWADEPLDVKSSMSPYWSLRRWPATVLGVVAVGATVVSQWSDGQLIAIDATRGTVAWRTDSPPTDGSYAGRRTGAETVYRPPALYLSGPVVLVTGRTRLAAFDAGTGRQLWTRSGPCGPASFTGTGVFACVIRSTVDGYDAATGRPLAWPALGAGVEPFACRVGRSDCRGVRTTGQARLIGVDGSLTNAPDLASPDTWLVGDIIVEQHADRGLTGRSLADDSPLWTWPAFGRSPGGARVVATEPDAIHLITADRQSVAVDPRDGLELSRIDTLGEGYNPYDPGYVYAADRFVYVERRRPGARPSLKDSAYYYPSPNVLVLGS